MALLDAISNVAAEAGYAVSTTAISSTDVTTKQLVSIAQRVIREMAIAYPWSKLFASGTITLAAGVASYALPAAFSYAHYESFWNSSTRWRVLGPMSPQEYAMIRGYQLNTTVYKRYQIRGVTDSTLLISPTPSSAEDGQIIIFEYIADRCARPQTWAAGQTVTSGDYTFYNGNYYTATNSGVTGSTAPTHTSSTASDGSITWSYYSGAYHYFLKDTDEPLLSQRVLEQGILERFAEIHGLESIRQKFNDQLNEEFSKDQPGKILYAGGNAQSLMFARTGRAVFGTWI